MKNKVRVDDREFKRYIPYYRIKHYIKNVAKSINRDLKRRSQDEVPPILLCVLNGSIMFTAELMKYIKYPVELKSIKLSSYDGMSSTGNVVIESAIPDVKDRDVIVVEDIVDTGTTIDHIHNILTDAGVNDIKYCTLFFKPNSYKEYYRIHYIGKSIPNKFIVGFGLDYNGLGRNLKDLYSYN